jgi:surface antigen
MSVRQSLAAAATVLALGGCATNDGGPGPKTVVGAGTGAIIGGLAGSAIGRGDAGSVVAGALIGGLLGGAIGASLDEQDRQRAYAAEMDALERGRSGAPVAWRNPDSGHYGTVVPGPAFDRGGRNCREYTHTIYIDGRPQTARGTACRQPDGTWQPMN